MNTKAVTLATLAAVCVLCATAVAARMHDGSLSSDDVDNTAVNSVDGRDTMSVPTDQANSADALQVTASIRKAVMADKSLSTSAHNVKIVTKGSTVTLRGPVVSAAEKVRVAALARQNAPGKDVLDQLTVKGA
jgi:hyperosmotically inducible periplasmic protein